MSGFDFNGNTYQTPLTASFVDDSAMHGNNGTGLGNILAIVGEANRLLPKTPTKISSYKDALGQFDARDTEFLKAIEKAFNPSTDSNVSSPDYIWCVSPRPDNQASLVWQDVNGVDAITVTANVAGVSGAGITLAIAAGSVANTLKVALVDNSADSPASLIRDNIKNDLFSVQYTGTAATATIQTGLDTNGNQQLEVTIGAVTTALLLSSYPTVGRLVAALNLITDVNATTPTAANKSKSSSLMDAIAATSIKSTDAAPLFVPVTAMLDAVIYQLNTMSTLVTATRKPGWLGAPVTSASALALIYTTPAVTATAPTDWQAAFDALKNVKCNWVVTMSTDIAVQDMLLAHVQYMSAVAFQERRAIVGLPLGSSIPEALSAAVFNDPRLSVVHQGCYDLDGNKQMTLYPPTVTAALLAGMMCGVTPGTPLTNKTINVSDMESRLLNPEETNGLLQGGVLCCWRDYEGNVRVLQSISTAQNTDNFNQHEMSTGVASDYVASALRAAVEPLRGVKNTPYLPAQLKAAVESRLQQLATPEPLGEGVIVGDKNSPAWRDLTVTQSLDSNLISLQVSPVIPNNYIGISIYDVPYVGTSA